MSIFLSDFDREGVKYKPLNITFRMQNSLAEKYNKEELLALLQRTHAGHAEVVRDAEAHEYVVRIAEGGEGSVSGEERIDLQGNRALFGFMFVDGQVAFWIRGNKGGRKVFHNGRWLDGEYDYPSEFQFIGEKLAFTTRLEDKRRVVVYDGKQIEGDYKCAHTLTDIGEKLAFAANLE